MILHQHLPFDPSAERALPGVAPMSLSDWLLVDEVYGQQMAERLHLLETRKPEVLCLDDCARAAAGEALDLVLRHLPEAFRKEGQVIVTPDGRRIDPDAADPLTTIGSLIQDDVCLLIKEGDQHVLRGAVLCFPASWTLAEKVGRPMVDIHLPVDRYTADLANRVQRMFNHLKPDRPIWRYNQLWYNNSDLYQPHSESTPHVGGDPVSAPFFRSERQCILRLQKTDAIVFSIHTYVLERARYDQITATPPSKSE